MGSRMKVLVAVMSSPMLWSVGVDTALVNQSARQASLGLAVATIASYPSLGNDEKLVNTPSGVQDENTLIPP